MDDVLRRSAAHVLVADVDSPVLDRQADHHVRRVLRLRTGATVTVTDGAGAWRSCHLTPDGLEPAADVVHAPPERPVTVAVAPPKGDRLEWMVQKCTEVGVARLVLLETSRSIVRWDVDRAARQRERLRRIAIEAAMQSRRVWLPDVCGPVAAATVLPTAAVAEPGGRKLSADDTVVAIGPEGGWTFEELALAADQVTLGPNVLRVETAAVVAAALLVAPS